MKNKKLRHLELSSLMCIAALLFANCSDDKKNSDASGAMAGQAGSSLIAGAGGEAGAATAANICGQAAKFSRCDPISAAPCDLAAGETCDFANDLGGFVCFPGPNPAQPGKKCDADSLFCGHSTTCDVFVSMCEHYCCADSDCVHGTCTANQLTDGDASIGLCYDEYQPVGAGGEARKLSTRVRHLVS